MVTWGEWNFSPETENRFGELCLKLAAERPVRLPNLWLELFSYNVIDNEMDVDDAKEDAKEEIVNLLKESLGSGTAVPEGTFLDFSLNSLTKILLSVKSSLSEMGFSNFCKLIASWTNDNLIELSLRLIVLPKLKETSESSAFTIFSLKELSISKPDGVCKFVLIPLVTDERLQFDDVELFSEVFSVLGNPQKDLLLMSWRKKNEFQEKDWLLLHPLIKDLPQTSLMLVVECIQKFSGKFKNSQVFGRFLVNFCKSLEFIGNKDALLAAVEDHQTLLKIQALKYLESV